LVALGILLGIVINMLGVWVIWESVIKPLKDMNPKSWSKEFPAPFYLWWAPIWFWHDLALSLIVLGTSILAYVAIRLCCGGLK
jgi:hypothetical protein